MRTSTSIAWKSSFGAGPYGPLELLTEPVVDLAEAADDDREVPVGLADVRFDTRDLLGQPAAVDDRDHEILDALPEERRDADLVELEAPRVDESEVVVAPPVDTGRKAAIDARLGVDCPLARPDLAVDRGQQRREEI